MVRSLSWCLRFVQCDKTIHWGIDGNTTHPNMIHPLDQTALTKQKNVSWTNNCAVQMHQCVKYQGTVGFQSLFINYHLIREDILKTIDSKKSKKKNMTTLQSRVWLLMLKCHLCWNIWRQSDVHLFENRISDNSSAVGLTYWIIYLIFLCFDICNYICLDTSGHFSVLPSSIFFIFSSTLVHLT